MSRGDIEYKPENDMKHGLRASLGDARRELLDIGTRNRLISTPRRRSRSSSVEVVDELGEQVFRILVGDQKKMSFLAHSDEEEQNDAAESKPTESVSAEQNDENEPRPIDTLTQPEDAEIVESELAPRHTDSKLQTSLTSSLLQKRLLRIYYDARTFQEEQGVNVLFLALGFLKWYEDDSSDRARYAPLLLVPVEIERPSARSNFRVVWTEEDITTNLSLQVKLKAEFGVELPDVPHVEDLSPSAYFEDVREAVRSHNRWEVLDNDIVLWFFAFAKLLMYRDLDPENWPEEDTLLARDLIMRLLESGFEHVPPIASDDENIDHLLEPIDTIHIVNADSSQSIVIEEVRRGRNLIIQGPPGTGKSQTIANLIGAAVCEGKRVLFVAEKVAALNVVKRRLANVGLGDMCLELHSNKARKRAVIEELGRVLNLSKPLLDDIERNAADLKVARDRLNEHCEIMHTSVEPSGATPYRVIGRLVQLRAHGTPPADFVLPKPESWTAQDLRDRESLLGELCVFIERIGTPAEHVWRGVMLDTSLPMDRERIAERLPGVSDLLDVTIQTAAALARDLHAPEPGSIESQRELIEFARLLANAPAIDRDVYADHVWENQRRDIVEVVQAGTSYAAARSGFGTAIAEVGWDTDVIEARRDIAARGRSVLRIFSGAYRRGMATLRGICTEAPPKPLEDRLAVLDTLIEGQKARDLIRTADELGRRAFGTLWRADGSDWNQLNSILRWDESCTSHTLAAENLRSLVREMGDLAAFIGRADGLEEQVEQIRESMKFVFDAVQLDTGVAFGEEGQSLDHVPLDAVHDRVLAWLSDPEGIARWIAYRLRDEAARNIGMRALCDRLASGAVTPEHAVDQFRVAYGEAMFKIMLKQFTPLLTFDGMSHEHILAEFKQLDTKRIALTRQQVAMAHFQQIPSGGAGIGELGIIRHELNKRRRHMPIRQLLKRAGDAITRIKPVFMMSPLSIAQYVEPGALEFDLLLIDEASQVRPVDALGAAARAKQMVVVGDDKQLPPTRFFSKSLDDIEPEEDFEQRVGDLESILGLCDAQNMPGRMLRWHYRSRHHSLIAVSNHEFYDDKLYVIPSPTRGPAASGVHFHSVVDGVYDRGGSATNRVEAERVADAVMKHAQECPGLSLGVGAFSVRQRDAILDGLERMRRAQPDLEDFFAPGGPEPFFVKNLENIQGDERDVIFISVCFGKDASGYMTMNFGPVSNEGGERRLNVLITRARQRCEVFSSITHDDIDLNRAKGQGPAALKAYLRFAQTGEMGVAQPTGRGHDSPFEEEVARAIAAGGYELDAQVGVAGFFIDLAVRDPDQPGRYLLGIECDGASYHSSRSARDRDRIRQLVLEDRGWKIYRIWSTDWFNQPQEQLRNVIAAIEQAKVGTRPIEGTNVAPDSLPEIRREVSAPEQDDGESVLPNFVEPYEEASFHVPLRTEIHELPYPKLRDIILRIIGLEGPIHGDEVAHRVRQLWRLSQTGSRIRRTVGSALNLIERDRQARVETKFFSPAEPHDSVVRNRRDVGSSTLRHTEMIPPKEINTCIRLLIEHHIGVTREEAIRVTARCLGFDRTSSQLASVIDHEITGMIESRIIAEDEDRLHLSESAE